MSKMALVIPAEELGCAFGQNYETMNGIAFVKEIVPALAVRIDAAAANL